MKEGFIASDGWYIEGHTAWFIGVEYNAIFQVDLTSLECEIICHLPIKNIWESRINPICARFKDYIVCFPFLNSIIYLYNIKDSSFQEIKINMPENVAPDIIHYWCDMESECIFAFLRGPQRVLTIDFKNKKTLLSNRIDENAKVRYAIKVDEYLWLPNSIDNRIFSYNLKNGKVNEYPLSNVKGRLYAVCYDGNYFWFTGTRQEVYLWKKGDSKATIIDNFPEEFYEYTSIHENKTELVNGEFKETPFLHCIFCNNSIWCIPFQTNMILRIDKDTHTISGIDDGKSADEILSKNYNHKYLLEYVREDRYIGLFSLCENCIFELDTQNCTLEKKKYRLINEDAVNRDAVVFSEAGINHIFYHLLLKSKKLRRCEETRHIGEEIYNVIINKTNAR